MKSSENRRSFDVSSGNGRQLIRSNSLCGGIIRQLLEAKPGDDPLAFTKSRKIIRGDTNMTSTLRGIGGIKANIRCYWT